MEKRPYLSPKLEDASSNALDFKSHQVLACSIESVCLWLVRRFQEACYDFGLTVPSIVLYRGKETFRSSNHDRDNCMAAVMGKLEEPY